jgi:regulator of replication initiation timing
LQALDNQKELVARTMTECQSLRLEKAALVSRMDILSEQQVSMQNALNQESAVMQEWHLRQVSDHCFFLN